MGIFGTTLTIKAVDLKDIKAIIDLMKKNSVSEFELEKQDFKIRLKRGTNGGAAGSGEDAPVLVYSQPALAAPAAVAALSNVESDLSFSLFIFVAQRIAGAREILEAGPLAKAERSSEERKAASGLFEPTRSILDLSAFAIQWPA